MRAGSSRISYTTTSGHSNNNNNNNSNWLTTLYARPPTVARRADRGQPGQQATLKPRFYVVRLALTGGAWMSRPRNQFVDEMEIKTVLSVCLAAFQGIDREAELNLAQLDVRKAFAMSEAKLVLLFISLWSRLIFTRTDLPSDTVSLFLCNTCARWF